MSKVKQTKFNFGETRMKATRLINNTYRFV